MANYAFDNAWTQARERLRGIEELLDSPTIRHLETLGVSEGWRCLEVGAGGGSITEWLCGRVGAHGHVLATDLDTRFLEELKCSNLKICRHDIAAEELPESGFDLVLSRLVLGHIAEREKAFARMCSALKPGGWLVCQDADNAAVALISPADAEKSELFMKVEQAKDRVMAARGHMYCGGRLYGYFAAHGLAEIGAEGQVPLLYAGTAPAKWKRLSVEQLRKDIAAAGLASEEEIDAYLALIDSPEFIAQGFIVMTAWGRRPLE